MAAWGRLEALVALSLFMVAAMPGALALGPSIAITAPLDGANVEGVVQVQGTAHSEAGVTIVQVRIDEGTWSGADSISGTTDVTWSKAVDTSTSPNGAHTLSARARDDGGEIVETSIQIVVSNAVSTDLRVAAFTGDTGIAGKTTLHLTVANDGSPGASGVVARFTFFYDGQWRPIADATFDVAASGTAQVDQDWTAVTKVGRFDVRVALDPDGAVAETSEANNGAQSTAAFWTDAVQGEELTDPVYPTLPNPAGPVTHYVLMLGPLVTRNVVGGEFDVYGPHRATIRQGDSVVWLNVAPDLLAHTATRLNVDTPQFDTGPVATLQASAPIRLTESGTFLYYCKLHLGYPPTAILEVLPSAM